jgi:hypothetical protein
MPLKRYSFEGVLRLLVAVALEAVVVALGCAGESL